ncbi:SH3 DOMAIN-CONTAINING [Salix purpurea]|uniref:SH3 DOMAIN-CONTAINING n=1 Tax=Salix purpurea TaxID=77065 RepID=A0A9Q0T9U3_SALPP|nr:SH3 DOMAIN-CONTAINING [Salix purpurea]
MLNNLFWEIKYSLMLSQNYILTVYSEVIHSFDAQAEGEMSLSVDDFVVVRQVAQTGWSEGERRGEAGWFPSAYIEKHENSPASKIMEESSTS